jgi:hypothetical protein
MYAPYAGAAGMLLHINEEQFDDTNRQNNGQKKKFKRTNNDLQNKHLKLKIE